MAIDYRLISSGKCDVCHRDGIPVLWLRKGDEEEAACRRCIEKTRRLRGNYHKAVFGGLLLGGLLCPIIWGGMALGAVAGALSGKKKKKKIPLPDYAPSDRHDDENHVYVDDDD